MARQKNRLNLEVDNIEEIAEVLMNAATYCRSLSLMQDEDATFWYKAADILDNASNEIEEIKEEADDSQDDGDEDYL